MQKLFIFCYQVAMTTRRVSDYDRPDMLAALFGGDPVHIDPISSRIRESEVLDLLNRRNKPGLLGRIAPPVEDGLRFSVDEWLDSGRSEDGVDSPWERHFIKRAEASHLQMAIAAFSEKYVRVIAQENGLRTVIYKPGRIPSDAPWPDAENAARVLFLLMGSELRFRLAKCTDCGIYYFRSKRKSTLKHGTRCDDCYKKFRSAGASEAMQDGRENENKRLCELVVKKFRKRIIANDEWFRDESTVQKMVGAVNEEIVRAEMKHKKVTRIWVVRKENREKIQSLAAE